MARRLCAVTVCLCLIVGCASGPPAQSSDPEIPEESQTDNGTTELETGSITISENSTRIAIASPESLELAVLDIDLSEAAETAAGIELRNVALEIFDILYPLLVSPGDITTPFSPASIYLTLFDAVRSGVYPSVSQDDISFLTLIIPTLAILNSTDNAVIETSRAALEQAESFESESILPDILLGLIAEGEGDNETAELRYRAASLVSPRCYPARMGLARIEIARGNGSVAVEYVEELLDELLPSDALYELVARAYLADGKNDLAERYAVDAYKISREPRILVLQAQIYIAIDKYSRVKNVLPLLEDRRPDDPEVWLIKAQVQEYDGLIDEAIETITRAQELFPDNPNIRDAYGRLQIRAGNTGEGREILEESLNDSPSNIGNIRALLDDSIKSGRMEDAAKYLARLLEIEERIDYLEQAVQIHREIGDLDQATEYAARRFELDGENPGALLDYALLLIDLGRLQESDLLLEQGIENIDDSLFVSEFYYLRSALTDDTEAQLDFLKLSLLKNRNNVDALIDYSRLLELAGKPKNAMVWLRLAVALRPDDLELQKKLEQLTQEGEE